MADSTALIALVKKYYVGLTDEQGSHRIDNLIRKHDQPKGKQGPMHHVYDFEVVEAEKESKEPARGSRYKQEGEEKKEKKVPKKKKKRVIKEEVVGEVEFSHF